MLGSKYAAADVVVHRCGTEYFFWNISQEISQENSLDGIFSSKLIGFRPVTLGKIDFVLNIFWTFSCIYSEGLLPKKFIWRTATDQHYLTYFQCGNTGHFEVCNSEIVTYTYLHVVKNCQSKSWIGIFCL